MFFVEADQSKQTFYDCYIIIDNMKTIGFWYCCCCEFSGCQIILNFFKNEKHCYFVCQFQDDFFVYRLHQIKMYSCYLNQYYRKILDRIEELRLSYKDHFWNKDTFFLVKNDHHNETVNFLFNLDVWNDDICIYRFI